MSALLCGSVFGQAYSGTVTAAGSSYTNIPTVTVSGGGCSSEPTFAATIATGAVNSVYPTFVGAGCTSAPTLTISGGGGSGATATASLLPATAVVLSAVPWTQDNGGGAAVGGSYIYFEYECWLTVPKARVPAYATANSAIGWRMPGTAQGTKSNSAFGTILPSIITAVSLDMTNGVLAAWDGYQIHPANDASATIEASIQASCSQQQTNLNNWNPWGAYGSFFNGSTWTVQGIQ